jgi:2,3-bisphosphoglycerate-independent phosphoglycerate mutase
VRDGDVVLMFNFRSDRARELSEAFLTPGFRKFDRRRPAEGALRHAHRIRQDLRLPGGLPAGDLKWCSGTVVARAGLNQLRIAETEKYPHVTYFFNGGVEKALQGRGPLHHPSPKDVPTYDFKPQMSAPQVTETVVSKLKDYDLVILNFANPDMVGHTGVVEAAIKAVETIDACVRKVVEKTLASAASC